MVRPFNWSFFCSTFSDYWIWFSVIILVCVEVIFASGSRQLITVINEDWRYTQIICKEKDTKMQSHEDTLCSLSIKGHFSFSSFTVLLEIKVSKHCNVIKTKQSQVSNSALVCYKNSSTNGLNKVFSSTNFFMPQGINWLVCLCKHWKYSNLKLASGHYTLDTSRWFTDNSRLSQCTSRR